jgi:hypothetical protein
MSHSNYQTLINRGRKAGLNTRELYSALAARSEQAHEHVPGQTDCNGYVSGHNAQGQRVFQPHGNRPRS